MKHLKTFNESSINNNYIMDILNVARDKGCKVNTSKYGKISPYGNRILIRNLLSYPDISLKQCVEISNRKRPRILHNVSGIQRGDIWAIEVMKSGMDEKKFIPTLKEIYVRMSDLWDDKNYKCSIYNEADDKKWAKPFKINAESDFDSISWSLNDYIGTEERSRKIADKFEFLVPRKLTFGVSDFSFRNFYRFFGQREVSRMVMFIA